MTAPRALIVANSPSQLSRASLLAAYRDVDLVIAADGGASRLLEVGVEPHVVVGDLDSLTSTAADELRARGVSFEVAEVEKDVTDLDLAVAAARRLGASEIAVVGISGGRSDHELVAYGTLARAADLSPTVVGPGFRACVLSQSGRSRYEVHGPAEFSLLSLLGPATVSCTGARWPLTKALLEPISSLGLSNRVAQGREASICVHEGIVLLYLL